MGAAETREVRIGVLGAAKIAPAAVIKPAHNVSRARVVSVAARDRARAQAFAKKHGIESMAADYEALIADPDVDAIYNPLPNGLHARWTIAALAAGKHVLCEKPFTANAAEADEVAAAAAERPELVVMEAFHYRYHPVAQRMREVVESGALGTVSHIETAFCFPLPRFGDIRYRFDLAGGATMDAGCYAVHMARLLGGEEPEVVSATAKLRSPDVDRAMTADLQFPGGATGRITCSMWSTNIVRLTAKARGDRGELRVINPLAPQLYHRITVEHDGTKHREKLSRRPTYEYQLEAFVASVLDGEPHLTPPSDSIANMRVIDAIYDAAGMRRRGT
jgi:predicted dehydrogenase